VPDNFLVRRPGRFAPRARDAAVWECTDYSPHRLGPTNPVILRYSEAIQPAAGQVDDRWAFRPLAGFIVASNVANGRERRLPTTTESLLGNGGQMDLYGFPPI
jgi:hypothetical protein